MEKNREYIVTVEKMLYGGSCLAHIDNFPVFIDSACPGDIIKIKPKKINKSFMTSEIIEIITPSQNRVKPFCPLYNVCGSCDLQHISYEEQLKQKKIIVEDTLNKIAGIKQEVQDTIPSPKIKEYRCKIQYPVRQTQNSKRFLTGYFKKNTHELINIKYCPLQPDIINKLNEEIKEKIKELKITAYNEKTNEGILRHIIYRISSDLQRIIIIFVVNSEKLPSELMPAARFISEKYKTVKGICVNFNNRKTNVIAGEETISLIGDDFYEEKLSDKIYKVSKTGFFQVNPYCGEKIFDTVKKIIIENTEKPTILDAYSGVGAFGIWLSDIANEVVCVEEVKSASNDAKTNAELNSINNIKIINGDAAEEFRKLIERNITFDVSVTDPPRKGCSKESIDYLFKLTSKFIIYVSCNVSTLARDLKDFINKGFSVEYIQPADMFPHTSHIETIVLLKKKEA